MKQIHDAIPPHCFQRKTLLSVSYILRDAVFVAALASLGAQISSIPSLRLRVMSWVIYTFLQGLVFTGLWELAHECGHQALSPSRKFNNSAGLLIHSLLLVPYHSWRFTHAQHHKSTNNMEQDIAFVPKTKEEWLESREARSSKPIWGYWEVVEDMPIINLLILVGHQLIAWPEWRHCGASRSVVYLLINNFALPRMRAYPWWKRSHFYFRGDGPNFRPSESDDVVLSTIGVGLVGAILYAAIGRFGFHTVFLFYGAPWLWTNHWILTITFLQHTDMSLPYYPNKTWSFLRGCASTIDRDFGFIGRNLFHGAIEYHVLHHHVCRIPFYHAKEASNAIQAVMKSHYKSDIKTPYLWAFWKNYNECRFVEERDPGSDIYFFGAK
ncbi:oleate delta-12 desaturase [Leptodontidium sp. MPI-SDFR-AT-0119]|nr:oleate delta-12 desaturase [Leptodontidium sp. MPI-SDFR-AT-0119]